MGLPWKGISVVTLFTLMGLLRRKMKRAYKKSVLALIMLICIVIAATPVMGKTILNKEKTKTYLDNISQYEMGKVANPTYGSVGGEWLIMGLARYGSLTQAYLDKYVSNLENEVKKKSGNLSDRKYTEYARVVLALTAIEQNPADFAGYDLLSPLSELDNVVKTGISGITFALIAFDSGNYDIPEPKKEYNGKKTTREKLVSMMISSQLSDGGWAYMGTKSDVDMTAMVIQALAKYYKEADVKKAVDKGVELLSKRQQKSGAFISNESENCESTAQVITAMAALGIEVSDERFIKDNNTVLDGILSFYKDGGFKHTHNSYVNQMATEQAMYALTAYYRQLKDENGLYDMKDSNRNIRNNKTVSYKVKNRKVKKQTEKKKNKKVIQTERKTESITSKKETQNKKKKNKKSKNSKKEIKGKAGDTTISREETSENIVKNTTKSNPEKKVAEKNNIGKIFFAGGLIIALLGIGFYILKRNRKLLSLFLVISILFSGCAKSPNNKVVGKCTILIECSTIFDNKKDLDKAVEDYVPKDGIILKKQEVDLYKDDSVYDILKRELKKNNILMEASFAAKTAYVEGINNIYEFSCGKLSGWMYEVNGEYPNVGCSDYKVKDKDVIEWHYTCNLGEDLKE